MKPMQMAEETPLQNASKAQQMFAKDLRIPRKSNIKNDDKNYLKNLHKIDLMDFAKDQVPEATKPSYTTRVQENYNLRHTKPSTSWHNLALNKPHHKDVKRVHENVVLKNAVVNNDTIAKDKETVPEATNLDTLARLEHIVMAIGVLSKKNFWRLFTEANSKGFYYNELDS